MPIEKSRWQLLIALLSKCLFMYLLILLATFPSNQTLFTTKGEIRFKVE